MKAEKPWAPARRGVRPWARLAIGGAARTATIVLEIDEGGPGDLVDGRVVLVQLIAQLLGEARRHLREPAATSALWHRL